MFRHPPPAIRTLTRRCLQPTPPLLPSIVRPLSTTSPNFDSAADTGPSPGSGPGGSNSSHTRPRSSFIRGIVQGVGLGVGFGGALYLLSENTGLSSSSSSTAKSKGSSFSSHKLLSRLGHSIPDYQAVYDDIAEQLEDLDHDDGSYAPAILRLAWHASGTYDRKSGTGGSSTGATMRFPPESTDPDNAGLSIARERLEAVKRRHPSISYADLWSLAGVVAVQEMDGPRIPWRPGRNDAADSKACPPNGRLPDASQGSSHVREIFEERFGFTPREVVALLGAHALGRCHQQNSGFDGPWTNSPIYFTNDFYENLLNERWGERIIAKTGHRQFNNEGGKGPIMMLPTDIALIRDKRYRPYVEEYARDQAAFFRDFRDAFVKLEELGVEFPKKWPQHSYLFRTINERDDEEAEPAKPADSTKTTKPSK